MHDAPLEAHEHTEHLAHDHHDPFVSRVAILVAVLAVLAAVSGNLEAIESEQTLVAISEATLEQDKATDAWGEYEADSLKRHLYTIAADANPAKAEAYKKTAKEQNNKQAEVRKHATESQAARTRLLSEAHSHEGRHHWLTGAATLFEIAIALSTVSLVTRRKMFWIVAALLGFGGLGVMAAAFA